MAINKVVFGESTLVDLTGTTATASDVANGKVFYAADGTLTTGTSSGGGGISANLVAGALRPDAELVETFTYDKYIVQDEGIQIPAYSTSAKILKASSALTSVNVDYTNYDYVFVERFLAIPEYSVTTTGKGRCEYWEGAAIYEVTDFESGVFHGLLDPTKTVATRVMSVQSCTLFREIYYSAATTLMTYATGSYGVYEGASAPAAYASSITPNAPSLGIRGHATYLSSEYFGNIDDVRYQWLIEVRRAPKGNLNIDGFGLWSSFIKANEAAESANHKLS